MIHKPFHRTRELIEAIDHDVKEAKDPVEALVVGVLVPFLLLPPVAIAEAVTLPFEQAYERVRELKRR